MHHCSHKNQEVEHSRNHQNMEVTVTCQHLQTLDKQQVSDLPNISENLYVDLFPSCAGTEISSTNSIQEEQMKNNTL